MDRIINKVCAVVKHNFTLDQKQCLCYIGDMRKQELIDYLGGTADSAAKKLDFAHRNSIQRYKDELTPRQCTDVIRRMKAKRIKIPVVWVG